MYLACLKSKFSIYRIGGPQTNFEILTLVFMYAKLWWPVDVSQCSKLKVYRSKTNSTKVKDMEVNTQSNEHFILDGTNIEDVRDHYLPIK